MKLTQARSGLTATIVAREACTSRFHVQYLPAARTRSSEGVRAWPSPSARSTSVLATIEGRWRDDRVVDDAGGSEPTRRPAASPKMATEADPTAASPTASPPRSSYAARAIRALRRQVGPRRATSSPSPPPRRRRRIPRSGSTARPRPRAAPADRSQSVGSVPMPTKPAVVADHVAVLTAQLGERRPRLARPADVPRSGVLADRTASGIDRAELPTPQVAHDGELVHDGSAGLEARSARLRRRRRWRRGRR